MADDLCHAVEAELDMDWINPWIGLDWVVIFRELYGLDWIGLSGKTVVAFIISNLCSTVNTGFF